MEKILWKTYSLEVDGVDFKIQEPWPYNKFKSKIWYSHKFNGPGLRYEVGVCIKTDHIVWTHDPFPTGKHSDAELENILMLIYSFLVWQEILKKIKQADDEYLRAGNNPLLAKVPGAFAADRSKLVVQSTVRACHETVNKRFKQWEALSGVFCHPLHKFSIVFDAVVLSTQLSLENGEPLFQVVEYND